MTKICLPFLFFALTLSTQAIAQTKTIEVTGSAERQVEPDEIVFSIQIEEYWEEEFEGKKWEDYKTKVEIETIEAALIDELRQHGIEMKDITLIQAGNFWRHRGKDFLVSKHLELSLPSLEKANQLATDLQTRGIKNMVVSRLKADDEEALKLEVKTEALLAAREKAIKLVSALGKELGEAISIVEVDRNIGIVRPMYDQVAMRSNMMEESAQVTYENYKTIRMTAEMRVVFEIK